VYFQYSFLNLFGIATKFIPFSFLLSITIFIGKHINDKELIILWSSGVNKISLVNLFLFVSILIFILNLIISSILAPYTLYKSRLLLSDEQINSILPAVRIQQFSDTFKGLTFIVSKKKNNEVQDIFLHDGGGNLKNLSPDINDSSVTTIIAKSGYIDKTKFFLFDGQLISTKINGDKNDVIKFEQMNLDMGDLNTTTIKKPKIQETSTLKLLDCFITKKLDKFCNENAKKEMTSILNRRMVMPFYIPVIALISSLLLINSNSKLLNRSLVFGYGFVLLIFAEMIVRYTGLYSLVRISFLIIPIFLIIFFYLFLNYKFSQKELINE
jgi:lipopolysaccharide export system permease protein